MIIEAYSTTSDSQAFKQQFSLLPAQVRDPRYCTGIVPPSIRCQLLDLPHPGPKEFWLAHGEQGALACLGAMVSASNPATGYIGFFECAPSLEGQEAITALLDRARGFLKAQGCTRATGPVQYNTWFPYRFRTGPADDRFFSWEPANPPRYVDLIQQAGFSPGETYHSTAFSNLDAYLEKTRPAWEKAMAKGFTFRPFDESAGDSQDLPALHRISHGAFEDSYLFEPIPLKLFQHLYVQIANKQHPCAYMVLSPKNREVGFSYTFVDTPHGHADKEKYAVIKSLAVMPEARGHGLSNALTHLSLRDAKANGATHAIAAMVRSGIQSESYAKKGSFAWQHTYSLFDCLL